jgi:signal transduction histidine kinase
VDDEIGYREGCRRALVPHGYDVDMAATGTEGWAKVQACAFDLVLIDVRMPDMSGIELLAKIRECDPDVVCMIITGYATVELAVEAMKLGAYDFIAKPFSSDSLAEAVEAGLERRRQEEESRRLRCVEEEAERLRQEKARLEELDQVKSAYVRRVAHELRAPLAAIRSFLTLILQGYATPQKQREMQERAAERADEMLELINDLLNLARLKSVKHASRDRMVSVDDLLRKVTGLHRPEAEAKQIRFLVDCNPCPPIAADPVHIEQLWTNLVSNAIKYTPKGGQVRVRLLTNGGEIVGEVSDTGIGIAAEDVPHLFEEFYRTEQAKALTRQGTGLGLAIVKEVVEEYGGRVEVRSEINRGTSFSFYLPVGK